MSTQSKITSFFSSKKSCDNFHRKSPETFFFIESTVSSDEELCNFTQVVLENLAVFEKDKSREQPATNSTPKTEITPGKPYIPPSPSTPRKSPQKYTTYTPSSRKYIRRVKRRIKKVKMDLNQKLGNSPPSISDDFQRACQQQDNVTIFLLQIIEDYSNDKSMHHLLGEKQHDLVVNFLRLKNSHSIKMFSKMYWLQWKWRREETLTAKYSTMDQENTSKDGFRILCNEGYLDQGTKLMTLDEWLAILSKPQLITVCKEFKIDCKNADKEKLVKSMHAYCSKKSNTLHHFFNQKSKLQTDYNPTLGRVLCKIGSVVGESYKISAIAKSAFDRLHMLMYLGIHYQILRDKKLNLLLLNVKNSQESFPLVDCNIDHYHRIIFPTYQHFVLFEEAHLLYEVVIQLTLLKEVDHAKIIDVARVALNKLEGLLSPEFNIKWTLPVWLLRFTPHYKYTKAIEQGVASLKNQKMYEEAINMLNFLIVQTMVRQHKKWHWYNEKSLMLHMRLGKQKEAAISLIDGLSDAKIAEESKDPLRDRALRLASLKKSHLDAITIDQLLRLSKIDKPDFPTKEMYCQAIEGNSSGKKARYSAWLNEGGNVEKAFMSVEDYALTQYINEGVFKTGLHVEGRLVSNIFLLLFWDIIYSQPKNVDGVFISRYQSAPLDLYYVDCFYKNRQKDIDERLSFIKETNVETIIICARETYQKRPEGEISLLNASISFEAVADVITCLSSKQLGALCQRLVKSLSFSGFPDLTLWNAQTKSVKFVEVKGQGDRLSFKQIQWISYLIEHGIDTEVCYVGKKQRKTIP